MLLKIINNIYIIENKKIKRYMSGQGIGLIENQTDEIEDIAAQLSGDTDTSADNNNIMNRLNILESSIGSYQNVGNMNFFTLLNEKSAADRKYLNDTLKEYLDENLIDIKNNNKQQIEDLKEHISMNTDELKSLVLDSEDVKHSSKNVTSFFGEDYLSNAISFLSVHKGSTSNVIRCLKTKYEDTDTIKDYNGEIAHTEILKSYFDGIRSLSDDDIVKFMTNGDMVKMSSKLVRSIVPYFYNNNETFKKLVDTNLESYEDTNGVSICIKLFPTLTCILAQTCKMTTPIDWVINDILSMVTSEEKGLHAALPTSQDDSILTNSINNQKDIRNEALKDWNINTYFKSMGIFYGIIYKNKGYILASAGFVASGAGMLIYNNPEAITYLLKLINIDKTVVFKTITDYMINTKTVVSLPSTATDILNPFSELLNSKLPADKTSTDATVGTMVILKKFDKSYMLFRMWYVNFVGRDYR